MPRRPRRAFQEIFFDLINRSGPLAFVPPGGDFGGGGGGGGGGDPGPPQVACSPARKQLLLLPRQPPAPAPPPEAAPAAGVVVVQGSWLIPWWWLAELCRGNGRSLEEQIPAPVAGAPGGRLMVARPGGGPPGTNPGEAGFVPPGGPAAPVAGAPGFPDNSVEGPWWWTPWNKCWRGWF